MITFPWDPCQGSVPRNESETWHAFAFARLSHKSYPVYHINRWSSRASAGAYLPACDDMHLIRGRRQDGPSQKRSLLPRAHQPTVPYTGCVLARRVDATDSQTTDWARPNIGARIRLPASAFRWKPETIRKRIQKWLRLRGRSRSLCKLKVESISRTAKFTTACTDELKSSVSRGHGRLSGT
jgi:hypothetical protein